MPRIKKLEFSYVQSALQLIGQACKDQPYLLVKIAVDSVEKGYATHDQVAASFGLDRERWGVFYDNLQEGDVARVPEILHNLVCAEELRMLTGFTDVQLNILERAMDMPQIMAKGVDERYPLMKELLFVMFFGVFVLNSHYELNQYCLKRPLQA